MDNHFGETQSINNQRWLRAKRGSSMNHDEGTYGCDGVCVMNPRWDGTHVGPTEGRFFRIYLMAAQLQHALITFIFFSSIPFPPSESLPYPIFSFSLICFLSKFAHNVLFVPHLILHTPPPPSLPIRFICVAFTITINLLYPLSLN